jgi:prepilin-type N-terminal cleavage/methylation domain-containing protein
MPRRAPHASHGEAGFTLLEILVAFSILAIGLLSIGVGQLSALRVASNSKNWSQGMNLAEEQMEIFRAQPWGVFFTTPLANQPDPQNPLPGNPHIPLGGQDAAQYNRFWTIQPNQAPSNLTQITITVTFNQGQGNFRTTSLTSVKGP